MSLLAGTGPSGKKAPRGAGLGSCLSARRALSHPSPESVSSAVLRLGSTLGPTRQWAEVSQERASGYSWNTGP